MSRYIVSCYITFVMSCKTYVMYNICYITYVSFYGMLYKTCHVMLPHMLYNMFHIMLYKLCYVMLYNIGHVMSCYVML